MRTRTAVLIVALLAATGLLAACVKEVKEPTSRRDFRQYTVQDAVRDGK